MPQGCDGQSPSLPLDLDLTPIQRKPIRLADATVAAVASLAPGPTAAVQSPAASIVVVTYNNLLFTQMCLASVLGNTAGDFEVIVVDNASTDGTAAYVEAVARMNPRVRLFRNAENCGFAAANNRGLAAANGRFLVLLNNDTIVPPNWLGQLIAHLVDSSIGLVGPVTNRIGNEAEIKTSYRTYGQMLSFATGRKGDASDIDTACMFCLAMRRDTYAAIGPLDVRFGIGMFEDDDYCIRAREAGYRVVCAEDCFVHHFGQASFGLLAAAGEYGDLFDRNRRLFEAKWRRPWRSHEIRPDSAYRTMVERVHEAVLENTEPGAAVLVVSKGDDTLLQLADRVAKHFPCSADGSYSGFHPRSGTEVLAHLNLAEAHYLVIPSTSAWWLDHYRELAEHLRHRRAFADDACQIFSLTPQPAATGGEA